MPLSLSQLAANRASVTLAYAGQAVTLEYAPALITEKTIADMTGLGSVASAADGDMDGAAMVDALSRFMGALNELLCRVILAWDVYEDDAQTEMVALTPDRLARLPMEFRTTCFQALVGGLRLGETTGTPPKARLRASSSTATSGGSRR